ncbi:MAG: anaerobic ribonucleoside-triphosphate reductase, partial [Candidatus Thermoplasmatota archaeon]|nr:anaerobic ribonucleoside-triphosphate reductase [Candidatus Thermoplasmatota archaeon]
MTASLDKYVDHGLEGGQKQKRDSESTDLGLFVRTSDEDIKGWDKNKIYDALIRETNISQDAAHIVAREVEKMLLNLDLKMVTAPLIRELTNAKLVEYGLAAIRRQHTRLGVPLYDVRQ